MKAWAKTLGAFAAVGTFAPLALAAALHVADRTDKDGGTADGAAGQHGLAGQPLSLGAGLDFSRAISSTKATQAFGQLIMPAASGQLTLAAFENSSLLEPTTVVVGGAVLSVPVSLGGAAEEAAGDGGFAIFRRDAGNSSRRSAAVRSRGGSLGNLTSGAGMISGPSGGGSAVDPESTIIAMVSGPPELGTGLGPGMPGIPGWHVNANLTVTPLPPAILAFLSGLAALFALRRARGRASEPAVG